MNKELTILKYYQERNKDLNYVNKFQSTSEKEYGKTFWHINVNFRTIFSFVDCFKKFVKYDGKDRNTRAVYKNGEQIAKHWTVRMQQSKLFKKENSFYNLTEKGKAFADFVKILDEKKDYFNDNDKWLIIYFFILNSYFNYIPNYIVSRTEEVFNQLMINDINEDYIKENFLELLKNKENLNKEELFKMDAFWIVTFAFDNDFLLLYKNASEEEKNNLYKYVIFMSNKSDDEIRKDNDLIAKKYISSGQYNVSMFVDDIRTLFSTYFINKKHISNSVEFLNSLIENNSKFCYVNGNKISAFVLSHLDVFDVIFKETILNITLDDEINGNENDIIDKNDTDVSKNLDNTTSKNSDKIRRTSMILKNMTKERSNYRCELEKLNGCKYFISKESKNNYLEVHHLVPVEFSNEFENGVEYIDNYVALCPHCHRLLHFGADREREQSLRFLYNERREQLKKDGIIISEKDLFTFYKFDK